MEHKVNNHPNPGLPDPSKASFKLLIYFKNGSRRTFYNYHSSYNAELKKIIICEKTGLNKLIRMILHKFNGAYKTALIYHLESGTQVMKYCYDKQIQCLDYGWEYRDGAVRMKLNGLRKVG